MYREQSGRGNCAVTDGRMLCCREISFAVGFMHFGVVMFWVKTRHTGYPPSVSFANSGIAKECTHEATSTLDG